MNSYETQYLALLQDIMDNGVVKSSRVGNTRSVFGRTIVADLSEGFPLLTTRKLSIKNIATELIWFLTGGTNIKFLVENGCNIWNDDAFRYWKSKQSKKKDISSIDMSVFLSMVKAEIADAGELGKVYGWHWNRVINEGRSHNTGDTKVTQFANLMETLKTDPMNRRMIVSAWDSTLLDETALPACHTGFQLNCTPDENRKEYIVDLMWTQRSADVPLGLPYNVASYAILLSMICTAASDRSVTYIPGKVIGMLGDAHVYQNQSEMIQEQLKRVPHNRLPNLVFAPKLREILSSALNSEVHTVQRNALMNCTGDFILEGYSPQSAIKIPLST